MAPIELLRSEDYIFLGKEILNKTDTWVSFNRSFKRKPLNLLRPHIELFGFLSDSRPRSPSNYLNFYRDVFETRGMAVPMQAWEVLEYRNNSNQLFAEATLNGTTINELMRIRCKFDAERNVFIIDDGHHRACFMYMHGFRQIPISITVEDLNSWLNLPYAFHVTNEIKRQNRSLIYTPILNPMLNSIPVVRENCYKSRLDYIVEALPDVASKRILDIGSNTGYFSFHFAREGADVVGCEPDNSHFNLAVALSHVYRLRPDFINSTAESYLKLGHKFDGAIILSVLYHIINKGEHLEFLKLIDSQVTEFFVWESGDRPEDEKKIIFEHTNFGQYKLLATTYATGKVRELGLFTRS
jgi:hypothetical protein